MESKASKLQLLQGDITEQQVDAIVNAANAELRGGGGVDGAIHRAGGPEIMAACDRIRARDGGCPTGQAVATTAGRLRAKVVIHTAGPIWSGGDEGEPQLLARSYKNSLRTAIENDCSTVAFPSISTGVYGYPIEAAARVAISTVAGELDASPGALDEIRFILFSANDLAVYQAARDELGV